MVRLKVILNFIFHYTICGNMFFVKELSCTNFDNSSSFNTHELVSVNKTKIPKDLKAENNNVQSMINSFHLSNKTHFLNNKMKKRKYFCGTTDDMISSSLRQNISRFKRYVLQGSKWEKLELTWAVVTPSRKSSVVKITEYEFSKALKVWSKASNLVFKQVSQYHSNIDIKVKFETHSHGDGYPFDGNGGTLAHAFYPGAGIGGDVHFDDSEEFMRHGEVTETGVSFFITAAHEIGHSLGIRHSNDEKSLMAPFYNSFGEDFDLPYDDKLAIQSLYGNPKPNYPIPTTIPTTTSTTTRFTTRSQRPTKRPIFPTKPYTHRTFRTTTTTQRIFTTSRYTTRPYTTRGYTTTKPSISFHYECKSNLCDGRFDAVTLLGPEIMLFRGECVWRIIRYNSSRSELRQRRIDDVFSEIRRHGITRIDAAYTLEHDEGIVMFVNDSVIIVKRNEAIKKNIRDINVITANRIDAAWRWGHNGHVYLLSGNQYWRLGSDGNAQEDYPRDSAVWRGLPDTISAATTYGGKTYFFAENVFWEFDNLKMRVKEPPMHSAPFWLQCPYQSLQADGLKSGQPSCKILLKTTTLYLLVLLLPYLGEVFFLIINHLH